MAKAKDTKAETIKVRSLTNPKVNGKYHLPGTVWDCPAELVDGLVEVEAVEVYSETPAEPEEQADFGKQADPDPEGDEE